MGPFDGTDVDTKLTLPNLGIKENQWTHMAATFDGETMAIYVNGVEAGSMAVRAGNPSIIFNDNNSSIGGRTHNSSYFKGLLDEFRALQPRAERDRIEAVDGPVLFSEPASSSRRHMGHAEDAERQLER